MFAEMTENDWWCPSHFIFYSLFIYLSSLSTVSVFECERLVREVMVLAIVSVNPNDWKMMTAFV